MVCPECGTSKVVTIVLNVGERRLTMRSCGRCETRWWDSDGQSIGLGGVLELATSRR